MKQIYALLADLNDRVAEVAAAVRRVEDAKGGARPARVDGPVELTLTFPDGTECLPPRQRAVLSLLLNGHGEKQVAIELGLSRNTVHHYVKAIYRHYGVSARSELLAIGIRSATAAAGAAVDPCREGEVGTMSSTPSPRPPPVARRRGGRRAVRANEGDSCRD